MTRSGRIAAAALLAAGFCLAGCSSGGSGSSGGGSGATPTELPPASGFAPVPLSVPSVVTTPSGVAALPSVSPSPTDSSDVSVAPDGGSIGGLSPTATP